MKCPHCDGTGQLDGATATVGSYLLAHRKARGWTQEEVAGKVGLSRTQVTNLEAGSSDMPLSRLAKFAQAFSVSIKDLVP